MTRHQKESSSNENTNYHNEDSLQIKSLDRNSSVEALYSSQWSYNKLGVESADEYFSLPEIDRIILSVSKSDIEKYSEKDKGISVFDWDYYHQ